MAQTELKVIGDVVLMEGASRYSRETYAIKSGTTLVLGELVELDTGELITLSTTEANCIGVVLAAGTGGDVVPTLVRHAIVAEGQLDYGSADVEADAIAQLLALGILVRDEAA
jgi:hypothetical protein